MVEIVIGSPDMVVGFDMTIRDMLLMVFSRPSASRRSLLYRLAACPGDDVFRRAYHAATGGSVDPIKTAIMNNKLQQWSLPERDR